MSNRRFFARQNGRLPLWRVFGDSMLAAIILGLISAVVLSFSGTEVKLSAGKIRVIDGDSLQIGPLEIRLWGIDAPEFNQDCKKLQGKYACGREARKHLQHLAEKMPLVCRGLGKDRYGRLLAVCRQGKTDINAVMVHSGYAYAFGGYFSEEEYARNQKLGIWAAENERPKAYRDRHKAEIDIAPGVLDAIYQWLDRFEGIKI